MSPILEQFKNNFVGHAAALTTLLSDSGIGFLEGCTVVDSGLSSDTLNLVVASAGADVSKGMDYFRERKRRFALWSFGAQAHLKQVAPSERETLMAMEAARFAPKSASAPGLEIRRVTTPQEVLDFGSVTVSIFDDPTEQENLTRFYRAISSETLPPAHEKPLFIGYSEGLPVTVGSIYYDGKGNANLNDLATVPSMRGKGFGSALFEFLAARAVTDGAVQLLLEASADGKGIYEKAGFQIIGEVFVYNFNPPQ